MRQLPLTFNRRFTMAAVILFSGLQGAASDKLRSVKIMPVSEVPLEKVEMAGAVGCSYRVAVSARDGAPNFAMRIFEVAPGGNTPLHHHPYEHEIYVMEGQGTVWRDGREVAIKPGDVLYIPADEQHQFKNAGSGAFKFMCLIPGQFQKC